MTHLLDDAAVLAAARSDPDGFVDSLPERVILDEVQRAPDLFRAIKRSVDARGRLVGIEVKKTASPTSSDFKGLRHLSEQTGRKFLRGILLYTGSVSVTFGPNLHAVPVSALWQLEAELTEP